MQIIPAILPKDFADLEEHVARIKGLVALVQVDICDGRFTPAASWPYKKHDANFEAITKEKRGLPFWQDIEYEFDLMIDDPSSKVDDFIAAGATRIVLHVEAKGSLREALEKLQRKVEIGLALNIDTSLEALEEFSGKFQYIQLMGIDRVGFQGQAFDDKVYTIAAQAKKKHPTIPIQIDGGVSFETAPLLKAAGAGRLIIGSAIFESENVVEAVEKFKALS